MKKFDLSRTSVSMRLASALLSDGIAGIDSKDINSLIQHVIDVACPELNDSKDLKDSTLWFVIYAEFNFYLITKILNITLENDSDYELYGYEEFPATRAVLQAIRGETVNRISSVSERIRHVKGYCPVEYFMESIDAGESIDQATARLEFKINGLKSVKDS